MAPKDNKQIGPPNTPPKGDTEMEMTNTTPPYLVERRENIKKNEEKMISLGLMPKSKTVKAQKVTKKVSDTRQQ